MTKSNQNQTKGTLFILISALFFSTYGIWSHLMSKSFGVFSQAWTRGLIFLVVIIILNFFFKFLKPISKKDLFWFIVIGLCGGLNQAPYFFGFKHLNVGTATLLFYSALVIGGYLIGKFTFKEKITSVKYLSLGLAILGMLLIYKLVLIPNQFLAASLTILAGFMGAGVVIFTKKISANYPEIQIMTASFIFMIIFNGLLSLITHDNLPSLTNNNAWLYQFSYMIAFLIANLSVIAGFKYLDASIGSLIGLAEIIFGILFGIIFFHETLTIGIIIGSILIIVSAILPNLRKMSV